MSMIKKLLAIAFVISNAASNAQQNIVAIGVGTATCSKFIELVKEPSKKDNEIKIVVESWIQGYLSGRNKQLRVLNHKQVDFSNVKEWYPLLIMGCGEAIKQGRGLITVAGVVDKIVEDVFEQKIRND